MRTLWLLVPLAVATGGCPDRTAPPTPMADPPVVAEPEAAEPEPEADPCVKACVAENQMRAVEIEMIEADCEAACAEAGDGKPPELGPGKLPE